MVRVHFLYNGGEAKLSSKGSGRAPKR
jgi:hypothetical protein